MQQRTTTGVVIIILILLSTVFLASAESLGARTLWRGLAGEDVVELQQVLQDLGYFSAKTTGYFGEITYSAVINFQQDTGLSVDGLVGPQTIAALRARQGNDLSSYVVQSGDSLWKIAGRFGLTVSELKQLNGLNSDYLEVGQQLKLKAVATAGATRHIVQPGDTLWLIARHYDITVAELMAWNDLETYTIYVGQQLKVASQQEILTWPDITYIVQAGDTVSGIAQKFGTSVANILKYNYMEADEWLNAGEKIAISGYAPRVYTVTPGEAEAPAQVGNLVDWFLEGQYLLKRGDILTIVDCQTGTQFKVKMMGGYNHADIEPLTAQDTALMKAIFDYNWTWSPRPVVVYYAGMNIAASLSGMSHSFDTVSGNNVTGHFDLYLLNSTSHSSASSSYLQLHAACVKAAAGQ